MTQEHTLGQLDAGFHADSVGSGHAGHEVLLPKRAQARGQEVDAVEGGRHGEHAALTREFCSE